MRQVITEREEVHRMSSKNKTEVLIDGKIYTLSGYESEEYLQRVATYINNKLAELKKLDGYARLSQELKSILLELNVADDYFKAKNQVEMVEEELAQKEATLETAKYFRDAADGNRTAYHACKIFGDCFQQRNIRDLSLAWVTFFARLPVLNIFDNDRVVDAL